MNYFNNNKIAWINNNSSINYNINNFNFNRYRFTNNNNNSLFRGICNDYFNWVYIFNKFIFNLYLNKKINILNFNIFNNIINNYYKNI